MKQKISVSMEESTIKKVDEALRSNIFRNKSHFIEIATEKLLQEVEDGKN